MSIKTEGILVRLEIPLNEKDKITMIEAPIIFCMKTIRLWGRQVILCCCF